MSKKQLQSGFTLVEMSIAVAFLSILLIAILTLTITAGKMYIKGNTNQDINQAGRDFSDTIRRDFLATGVGLISPVITVSGGGASTYSGRICLGTISYLWNSADLLNATSSVANSAKVKMASTGDPVIFARIVNPKQSYCDKDGSGKYPMTIPANEQAADMFGGTGRDYALYRMTMKPVAIHGDSAMYQVAYTVGTNQSQTTQTAAGGFIQCKPNNVLTADFNYCSVNDFDMIVRVGGKQ